MDSSVFDALKERGFVKQTTNDEAVRRLLSKPGTVFYVGFDPTASSLHVGSMVPLMAMAHLHRAGLKPLALVGGGTAMVGDPSGKTEMRQLMTAATIRENLAGIEPQIRRFLGQGAEEAMVVNNADWLADLGYIDFLRTIGRHFSVNKMLSAEAYKQRMEKGLSFIEFNYQLLQAYDFLVLNRKYNCELQVGGDDQWSNMLAGADLIRRIEQKGAESLTFPLLLNSEGQKMGKTAQGAVWLDAERTKPFDFYQYFINVDDRDVGKLLRLLTFLPMGEVRRLEALEGAEIREAKRILAREITGIVHGAEAAAEAAASAKAAFGPGAGGAAVPTFEVPAGKVIEGYKIVDLLADAGLAASRSAARRLVAQGGVKLGDARVDGIDAVLPSLDADAELLLRAGKKHVRRIVAA